MSKKTCNELAHRLGLDRYVQAITQDPVIEDSGLLQAMREFHFNCERLVHAELFDEEFKREASKIGKKVRSGIQAMMDKSDAGLSENLLSNISTIIVSYPLWWASVDYPHPGNILKMIAMAVYTETEKLFSVINELPFKRALVQLRRDFGIVPVVSAVTKSIRTFETMDSLSKNRQAFNDFERSLKKAGMIHEDCPKRRLRSVFKNEGIEQKILWLGTISELSFLVKELINKKVIKDPGQAIWEITLACFEVQVAKGKVDQELRRSLREAKQPSKTRQNTLRLAVGHLYS